MLYVHFTVTYFPFDGATLLVPYYVFDKILLKHILCFGNLLYNNHCTTILRNFIVQICCATILYNNIVQFIIQYCCTTLLYNNVVQLCCKCDMAFYTQFIDLFYHIHQAIWWSDDLQDFRKFSHFLLSI